MSRLCSAPPIAWHLLQGKKAFNLTSLFSLFYIFILIILLSLFLISYKMFNLKWPIKELFVYSVVCTVYTLKLTSTFKLASSSCESWRWNDVKSSIVPSLIVTNVGNNSWLESFDTDTFWSKCALYSPGCERDRWWKRFPLVFNEYLYSRAHILQTATHCSFDVGGTWGKLKNFMAIINNFYKLDEWFLLWRIKYVNKMITF